MKRLPLFIWAGLGLSLLPLPAQRFEQPISDATSNDYPQVSSSSTDPTLNQEVFDLAVEARRQLSPLLHISYKKWRFPVHFRIVTEQDPLAPKIHHPIITVTTEGNTLNLFATIPAQSSDVKELIQRQLVTVLLWEVFFAQTQQFDSKTDLEVVPFWLREGLRENLNEQPRHDHEEVVLRATQGHRTPTLDDIQQWHEFSRDLLLGLWQRAFCDYLVNSMIRDEPRKKNFRAWLTALTSSDTPAPASSYFLTQTAWERELADAGNRHSNLVFNWEETLTALNAEEALSIPATKDQDARLTSLDQIMEVKPGPALQKALMPRINELIVLEQRAHPSWRDVISSYRQGLTLLLSDQTVPTAGSMIAQAKKIRAQELLYHTKLVDYANWFEVTHDHATEPSQFEDYMTTAAELEHAQADDPNPLLTDLLKVEDKL